MLEPKNKSDSYGLAKRKKEELQNKGSMLKNVERWD